MKILKHLLLVTIVLLTVEGIAQTKNRIQPGRIYKSGETLYAPRFGFTAKVPEGWDGMLPRENEVFLLMTTTAVYGEVFVFGNDKGNLNTMRENWAKGFDLNETMRLKAINPTITNDILSGEVVAEGEYINKAFKGFAISKCSPDGPCVITLMIAPTQHYDAVKNMVETFMKTSSFTPPSNESPYANFDWKEFLSNKSVVGYAYVDKGTKESTIHLCADGTFTANVKKTGIFKEQNPSYRGNHSGTWEVSGSGETTTIKFTFKDKKAKPLEAILFFKDEKIFVGEERYFVGVSDKCK